MLGLGSSGSSAAVSTPDGQILPAAKVCALFEKVGFTPPEDMPLQDAFDLLMAMMLQQSEQPELRSTPPRGRTAVSCTMADADSILEEFGAEARCMQPLGVEVKGVDTTEELHPRLVGALEQLMAHHGLVLFKNQGKPQKEKGVEGRYLTGDQQCQLSLAFGIGKLHSTHDNHHECPNRDIFRLSNNQNHGFNEVGPEWHNDGSFEREVFSHVVYHIIKAPECPGQTAFAHLGKAYDALPPEQHQRLAKCASVNSNSGVVHPMVHEHSISGRKSLYLHTGMTGSILERAADTEPGDKLSGIKAWNHEEMDKLFQDFTALLDRPDISFAHSWEEGDVIVIDNLAVAHKAMPGAHQTSSGLRILHRTTCAGLGPLDPAAHLGFPMRLGTSKPCPFKDHGAIWVNGYVGFRWGDYKTRSVPH